MQEAENAFFARINHEIQTPVSGILEAVDLIAETPLDDRQQTIVATLKSRADSLLALVNNLLDLSQLEAGKLTLEERDFDFRVKSLFSLFLALRSPILIPFSLEMWQLTQKLGPLFLRFYHL